MTPYTRTIEKVTEALAGAPLDYEEEKAFVGSQKKKGISWQEAGVLVLMAEGKNGLSFILNKRSQEVSQPGDLCFPGGHALPIADRFVANWIIPYVLPMRKSQGYAAARQRRPKTFETISFYLANALRECWEEMRVGPRKIDFLGALPCYRLVGRRKIVYPMVGRLTKPVKFKISYEIEKNVCLPLKDLWEPDNYGLYSLKLTGKYRELAGTDVWNLPCFAVAGKDGSRDILWGATFMILMNLLKTVFGFTPPMDGPVRAKADLYPAAAKKRH
ncbi:hypothetical protein SAMN02745216_01635 [Desulfatibacillum alkenivorans DSM 16219]|uniref:Nudix hydrolase domain-containing protein n=1 Tax=Desulfatibacillum alkenivorans DSM 16219 TaxID=1121393 RepID=A0A1M6J666_9BACT|nr:CoA pyrophosphatase [Desulfatibacillum alkenivorans]SHJ42165.1 hypothetical protein SAMN02745216_01635 [Desulfatibacillum alkenivorans DSM 16219]